MLCSPVANLVNEKLPVPSVTLFHSSDQNDDDSVVMGRHRLKISKKKKSSFVLESLCLDFLYSMLTYLLSNPTLNKQVK